MVWHARSRCLDRATTVPTRLRDHSASATRAEHDRRQAPRGHGHLALVRSAVPHEGHHRVASVDHSPGGCRQSDDAAQASTPSTPTRCYVIDAGVAVSRVARQLVRRKTHEATRRAIDLESRRSTESIERGCDAGSPVEWRLPRDDASTIICCRAGVVVVVGAARAYELSCFVGERTSVPCCLVAINAATR